VAPGIAGAEARDYSYLMSEVRRPRPARTIEPIFKSVLKENIGKTSETPIYIGDRTPVEASISLIQYNQELISFVTPDSIDEILAMQEEGMVNWVNVNGLADQDLIKRLCGYFRLDSLTIEDILNTEHRPKAEDFGHYFFLITKMITRRPDGSIEYEQVSIVITRYGVLTIQETPGDCFGPVRERLRTGVGRLRRLGSSFLAYALLDVITDNYFSVLEGQGDQLERQETLAASEDPGKRFMMDLQAVKADLNRMRRTVWPVREAVGDLQHSQSEILEEGLDPFLRDLYENTVQVLESLEVYREAAASIQEVYLASVSNRLNEVMKVLTVISTVFIPLTFIVGIYGMNFRHMPELDIPWAYPATWGGMILIGLGMMAFFKKKKWF
jgi:magnesium transporter